MQRHEEPVVVVAMLPGTQRLDGGREVLERGVTPTLLLVDAMTAFHCPVLFRLARLNMPQVDAGFLQG